MSYFIDFGGAQASPEAELRVSQCEHAEDLQLRPLAATTFLCRFINLHDEPWWKIILRDPWLGARPSLSLNWFRGSGRCKVAVPSVILRLESFFLSSGFPDGIFRAGMLL